MSVRKLSEKGSQIKSGISCISTRSDLNHTASLQGRSRYYNTPLPERVGVADMKNLHDAFREAYQGKLFPDDFRKLLREQLSLEYEEDEFKLLFLKINANHDGAITWDELVSHLIAVFYTNDSENQNEFVEPPILGFPRLLRSMHRNPISRIIFCPCVNKDRSVDWTQGSYVTASREGMIAWWSLDMTLKKTAYSSSPALKCRTTWVTDMVCLPDVSIIATSSTERELRFYDSTAGNFALKILISSWEYMICTMYYYFPENPNEQCMLICGDVGGYVRVLTFSPIMRGPFKNTASATVVQIRHFDLQKHPKILPTMKLVEFPRAHTDWVRQVYYYESLHCIVSCATCNDSLLMCDLSASKTHTVFHCEKGILCFVIDEETHLMATGGPDCNIRIWSSFVPAKPNMVLTGHHAGIISLVLQNNTTGQLLYSLSRNRMIKVWDVATGVCVQNYFNMPPQLGERTPISTVYNATTREWVFGAIKLAILTLKEQINDKYTDGYTHSRIVSKVLYNPLFKVVITCGMDSIIFNFDPVTGKRNMMVRNAHTKLVHGEEIPVEITAACFDPANLLLLTGARNGTLKVWNFNTGECLRVMITEKDMEVTQVFWIEGDLATTRILAVGWDQKVTEFEASGASGNAERLDNGKNWLKRHSDDILAGAILPPVALATASYNSELILWKLETGQPYRRFSCTDPLQRIKLAYSKRDMSSKPRSSTAFGSEQEDRRKSSIRRPSCIQRGANTVIDDAEVVQKARARRLSTVSEPARITSMRQLAVHAMIFLTTRPLLSNVASLMVSLENGMVQAWSVHSAGGIRGQFQGVHTAGDYVSAMATDVNNDYLFTGTTVGYVKVWLMKNYVTNEPVHVCMPALRLEFPFLWRDRIEGRAKRCVRDQPLPLLLNSYRAHMRCITSLAYIDEHKLLVSGSSDYSVRVWRLSGEYINTLGGIVEPWTLEETRIPRDVSKVASFTTFKVWRAGYVDKYVPGKVEEDPLSDITDAEIRQRAFGKRAPDPLLGKYFKLPPMPETQDPIVLDDSLPIIPLYCHLRMAQPVPVKRPPTPELVRQTRLKKPVVKRNVLNFDLKPTSATNTNDKDKAQ